MKFGLVGTRKAITIGNALIVDAPIGIITLRTDIIVMPEVESSSPFIEVPDVDKNEYLHLVPKCN